MRVVIAQFPGPARENTHRRSLVPTRLLTSIAGWGQQSGRDGYKLATNSVRERGALRSPDDGPLAVRPLVENALLRQQLIAAQGKIQGRVRWAPVAAFRRRHSDSSCPPSPSRRERRHPLFDAHEAGVAVLRRYPRMTICAFAELPIGLGHAEERDSPRRVAISARVHRTACCSLRPRSTGT
jgi:hypothetical protein